jgi:chromosome segregation ATPase
MDRDFISKRWSSYLKDFDGKLKNNKGEYFLDNAKIPSISPDTLDIYSKVEELDENVVVTVAINKNGEYINNASGQYVAADDLLKKFVTQVKKEKADEAYEAAEKKLRELERDMKSLKSKNEDLSSDIKTMQSRIADNERSIKENEKRMDDMRIKLGEQENEVKQMKARVDEFK